MKKIHPLLTQKNVSRLVHLSLAIGIAIGLVSKTEVKELRLWWEAVAEVRQENLGGSGEEPSEPGEKSGGENEATAGQVLAGERERAVVVDVIDGDTSILEGGQRLRYIGIDTPETKHPTKPVECFGQQASEKNALLVTGKEVELEKDVNETDRYGRLLRYVYVDGVMINELLVREGYAQAVSFPPDVNYQERLQQAEQKAREEALGLWGEQCASPATE